MNEELLNELRIPLPMIRSLGVAGCTGRGICVAVVDSGVQDGHPHVGRVDHGVRIDMEESGSVRVILDRSDAVGHGTACAGVIRALAPACALASVRILDASLVASSEALVSAIVWATDEGGADVINLSLGTRNREIVPRLEDACRRARKKGAIIVAAAGNDRELDYPAGFPDVIGVTSSSNGRFSVSPASPPIFYAPPYPRPIPGRAVEDNFKGPSFATARITGLIALMAEAHDGIDSVSAMEMLSRSFRKLP
ncbi:MAG: hypothetical protein A2Z06_02155 [Candidatus Glassbacteria bacterium RBG_16_58_8]|uniref:Peptidase S8/S53 domain-containing protein n=1 Tax=Candidatus Glassbacteria bacterium RBG_16_58_8 TaxID=1817866 RepID=A0A1F5YCH0_9BACT|nr:MAG: hypothetical protein A2Z06_02155 [Candidatus Glassbacteria bacterium RBG_16_58_8]